MELRKNKDILPIYSRPGDTITVLYDDKVVAKFDIVSDLIIDNIKLFDVNAELGFSNAIAVVLGKSINSLD